MTPRDPDDCSDEERPTTRVPSSDGSTSSTRTSNSASSFLYVHFAGFADNQVNLKMCFEGMEENGSENLDKFIESEKDKFFAGVDCMCISGQSLQPGLHMSDD